MDAWALKEYKMSLNKYNNVGKQYNGINKRGKGTPRVYDVRVTVPWILSKISRAHSWGPLLPAPGSAPKYAKV